MSLPRELFLRISLRWIANSFGLWTAGRLIPFIDHHDQIETILIAGLVLSIINTLIRPLVVILSLPAILFSLGLFMFFINGLMVYLVGVFVSSFEVQNFGAAVLAGLVIGLVNYIISAILEEKLKK